MCKVYGNTFQALKWVDEDTLAPYQTIDADHAAHIDMARAKNEIALFDIDAKKTVYGLSAFLKILGHNRPLVDRVLNAPIIHPFLEKLYAFISYNRKVMYPTVRLEGERDCTPDVHLTYRWAWIILVAIVTGLILNSLIFQVNAHFGLAHNWTREFVVCFGQIAWQGAAVLIMKKEQALDYLGNMSTVSFLGGIALFPLVLSRFFMPIDPLWIAFYFMIVVTFMFFEHVRRCKMLGLPFLMTISWVTYRTIVLAIILWINFG